MKQQTHKHTISANLAASQFSLRPVIMITLRAASEVGVGWAWLSGSSCSLLGCDFNCGSRSGNLIETLCSDVIAYITHTRTQNTCVYHTSTIHCIVYIPVHELLFGLKLNDALLHQFRTLWSPVHPVVCVCVCVCVRACMCVCARACV